MLQRDNIVELTGVTPSELKQIKEKRDQEPGNVVQDWNYGQRKIELYINDNLKHIKQIFRFSVAVMIAGGILISAAIIIAILEGIITKQTNILAPAAISGIAGIITEFIGTTFLFIYRSTMQQASSYIKTLERINSIDMAMKITNTMSNRSTELKDKTRCHTECCVLVHSRKARKPGLD